MLVLLPPFWRLRRLSCDCGRGQWDLTGRATASFLGRHLMQSGPRGAPPRSSAPPAVRRPPRRAGCSGTGSGTCSCAIGPHFASTCSRLVTSISIALLRILHCSSSNQSQETGSYARHSLHRPIPQMVWFFHKKYSFAFLYIVIPAITFKFHHQIC